MFTSELTEGHYLHSNLGALAVASPADLLQIEIWHMFNAIQSRGLRSGMPTSSSTVPASSRVCMPVAMQLSRAGNPPLIPLDRDDLGYLMPPAPAVV